MKKKATLITTIISIALLGSIMVVGGVQAQSDAPYKVLAPLPCIEGNGIECPGGGGSLQEKVSFKTYIQYTINLLIALSAVLAVAMIVWGGIEYMTTGSFQGKKDGLTRAKNAIYGLLLILSSYLILRTIDPRLVEIPNTLVPQITIKSWLARDASQILLNSLYKDIEEYNKNRADIGLELQQQQKEMAEKQIVLLKEIEEIENKINNWTPNSPESRASLEIEKAKKEDQLVNMHAGYQVTKAISGFNGSLSDAAAIMVDSSYTISKMDVWTQAGTDYVKNQIKALHKIKGDLKTEYDKAFNSFKAGYSAEHNRRLDDRFYYSEAIVDLYTIKASVDFARKNTATFFILPNGEEYKLSDKQMRAVLDQAIAKVDQQIEKIKDPELQEKIKGERDATANALNFK